MHSMEYVFSDQRLTVNPLRTHASLNTSNMFYEIVFEVMNQVKARALCNCALRTKLAFVEYGTHMKEPI